jgi:hypothetical protein
MSIAARPQLADPEAIFRDWYDWAWQATDRDNRKAVAVAVAAVAATERGAGFAGVIAAANAALSGVRRTEPRPASQALTAQTGRPARRSVLLIGLSASLLFTLVGIALAAGSMGVRQTSLASSDKRSSQGSTSAVDSGQGGKTVPNNAAADGAAAAPAAARSSKAPASKAGTDKTAAIRAAYSSLVVRGSDQMVTAATLVVASCVTGDVAGCRRDSQQLRDTTNGYLRDLNAMALPTDFATADGLVRQAMNHYLLGSAQAIKGVTDSNADEVTAALGAIQNGTDLLGSATTSLPTR